MQNKGTREKIIEFAGVKLVNGKVKEKFETLINAKQHIRKSSQAVHGISEEDLVDAPSEEEIYPKIFEFIGDAPVVAHNAIIHCKSDFGRGKFSQLTLINSLTNT